MGIARGQNFCFPEDLAMKITPKTDKTLLAAQGYFELGMLDDALEELDTLPPDLQEGTEVLQMRLFIHMREKRWPQALEISRTFCRVQPEETLGFIHAAFCLHELRRTAEAKAFLLSGPAALLGEATYHYNLGCYDATLGNIEEAQAHLRTSFKLDGKFREYARTDPDLKPVWGLI